MYTVIVVVVVLVIIVVVVVVVVVVCFVFCSSCTLSCVFFFSGIDFQIAFPEENQL